MNKYLYKKIEQNKGGAYIESLVFIANEVCRDKQSETFEQFTELNPKKIADVLGWNDKKETLSLIKNEIEDSSLAGLLLRYGVTGFLAQCMMPECSGFIYNKKTKEPRAWSVQNGICRIFWIYSESIGELIEKLEEKSNDIFSEYLEKEIKSKL